MDLVYFSFRLDSSFLIDDLTNENFVIFLKSTFHVLLIKSNAIAFEARDVATREMSTPKFSPNQTYRLRR